MAPLGSRSCGRVVPAGRAAALAIIAGHCRQVIGQAASLAGQTSQAATTQITGGRRTGGVAAVPPSKRQEAV